MTKRQMPKDQLLLLKKALKGLNDFAKDGKLIFTPTLDEKEIVRDEAKS